MPLTFEDLVASVTHVGRDFRDASVSWRWLLPEYAEPLLVTAMGDVFVAIQGVSLLDTARGTLQEVATDQRVWTRDLEDTDRVWEWFWPDLVKELRDAGLTLESGEVYSPLVPVVLGGPQKVENYGTAHWTSHLNISGKVHEQVRDLPLGTPIDRIVYEHIPRPKRR